MNSVNREPRGCRYWLKLLVVGLLGGLLIFLVGYEVLWINAMVAPANREICCQTPADFGLDYQDVTFVSADGVELSGWYIPSQNGAAVLMLHGYNADRIQLIEEAEILARHGFGILLYDMRAHGESEGEFRSFGWQDILDVPPALEFLQAQPEVDSKRIGIYGFSVGGQVALRAAAEMDAFRAVAVDGPGLVTVRDAPPTESFGERLIYVVNRIDNLGVQLRTGLRPPRGVAEVIGDISPRPLFLIATGLDDDLGRRLAEHYYDLAGEPKTLWVLPEATHNTVFESRPEEFEQRIVAFFTQALLGAPPSE